MPTSWRKEGFALRVLRIFFSKTGEAAYISHLDLQRVMARALRKSGLPVWWSQGFNPHIYMSFALPLPLLHESVCESVDVKTESEETYFSQYVQPLTDALPQGIAVNRIADPLYGAEQIRLAEYSITYPGAKDALRQAVAAYNALGEAMVTRKTKRSQQQIDLKTVLPTVYVDEIQPDTAVFRLPAGSQNHFNPALLAGLWEELFGLPAAKANIVRRRVFVENEMLFS